MTKENIIAIDIGGTSTKIGFVHIDGHINHKWIIPTNITDKGMFIVQDIWESIKEKIIKYQIDQKSFIGIGVGAPGFTDPETGIVYQSVNIGWKNFHLANRLKDKSNLPVYVGNDANIAALGEYWQGAGRGAKDLIAITIGTGVGGGIIADGHIINGTNGTAGEIGHMIVEPNGYLCNCGRRGCLETIVSATGIVRQGMKKLKENPTSKLAQLYNDTNNLTSKDIFKLATENEPNCLAIVQRTSDLLGFTIANLAIVTNPSKILIGGGVSKAGDQLLEGIKSSFEKHTLPRTSENCELAIAQLENDAGMIGAAYLVVQNVKEM